MMNKSPAGSKVTLGSFIFLSRWLQAPLYLGLIVAQGVYVFRFVVELWHLIGFALLGHPAPQSMPGTISANATAVAGAVARVDSETVVMLKVKLAMALIGISSIHLLKTFINAHSMETQTILWQVVIHVVFLLSAVALAWIDRLTYHPSTTAAHS